MLIGPNLILLGIWFLTDVSGSDCPVQCKCIYLTDNTLRVDCNSQNLKVFPSLPRETEELYLQENLISVVPAGAFDNLINLKKLNLSSNPLHCDCRIRYLIMWLSDGNMDGVSGIRCVYPAPLYGKPVSQLTESEISSCSRHTRLCSDFLFNDAFLYALLFPLFFLMILCLRTFKMIKFEIKVSENDIELRTHPTPKVGFLKRRSISYLKVH
ncbi:platelet glycoprotein IX-like [Hyla sarda]|uniref:platelet glycoprotein IX-like n=1 Tax=Hyla sarda TaxID=327740 RepID=UPI0024C3A21F|nr:platelet glycoprotein IX-like [Hyla sarda]XP_056384229.1 platelet glycoprotein IX-like [Hyla sarda]XP_056384230.1 platelet glycoprotein IX-like [Hyla sarda]